MSVLTSSVDRTRVKHILRQNIHTLGKITRGKRLVPYIGLTGHNNLGDEVMYEAHQTLFPSFDLVTYRKDAELMQKAAKLRGRPFRKVGILGGGTLINDGEVWLGRAEQLLAQGYRVFCLGTGAESSAFYGEQDENSQLLKRWVRTLEQFEFVGVRGPQSLDILKRAGAKNVVVMGDPALALTPSKVQRVEPQGIVGITYGDVPGNPMWGDRNKFREEMKKVIRALLDSGLKVRLLPVWDIDLPSNRSLLAEIDHPECTMVEAFESFHSFSRAVRQCDFFVGQKLHATIVATMNRVPSIMVEYRPKCRDFMASVGLEHYIMKTSEFDHVSFKQLHKHLVQHAAETVAQAEAKMLEYKHFQFEQAKRLTALFD